MRFAFGAIMEIKTTRINTTASEKPMTVRWLAMENGDFFTTSDAAILLGVEGGTIRKLCHSHKLSFVTMSNESKQYLIDRKIITHMGRTMKLVPRATLDELVKIINTPETKAIWTQVLKALRDPKENVALQYEMYGNEGLARLQAELTAKLALTLEQQTYINNCLHERLTDIGIRARDSYYTVYNELQNGTVNSFRKMIIAEFGPEKTDTSRNIAGHELYTNAAIGNQGNYQTIVDRILKFTPTEEQLRLLKRVEDYNNANPNKADFYARRIQVQEFKKKLNLEDEISISEAMLTVEKFKNLADDDFLPLTAVANVLGVDSGTLFKMAKRDAIKFNKISPEARYVMKARGLLSPKDRSSYMLPKKLFSVLANYVETKEAAEFKQALACNEVTLNLN